MGVAAFVGRQCLDWMDLTLSGILLLDTPGNVQRLKGVTATSCMHCGILRAGQLCWIEP